jgi:hypothetical protein
MNRLTFLQRLALVIAGDPMPDAPDLAWADLERREVAEAYLARARSVMRNMPPMTEAMIDAFYEAHARAGTVFADPREWWPAIMARAAERDQAPATRRAGDVDPTAPAIGGVLR